MFSVVKVVCEQQRAQTPDNHPRADGGETTSNDVHDSCGLGTCAVDGAEGLREKGRTMLLYDVMLSLEFFVIPKRKSSSLES